MSNIFIINAGVKVHGTGGELNSSLTEMAKRILVEHGHSVIVTDLNENWQLQTEIQHIPDPYLGHGGAVAHETLY